MKRITALIMALAMILSLAACGGKADQPSSNNTSPVTQEGTSRPDSPSIDSTRPSEPMDTTPDEPKSNLSDLPELGFFLYDGVHYLVPDYDDGVGLTCVSTAISGEKAAKDTIEVSAEVTNTAARFGPASMSVILGRNTAPFDYQLFFEKDDNNRIHGLERNVAPGNVGFFDISGASARVANLTDTDKTVADCPIVYFECDPEHIKVSGTMTIDGQSLTSLDDYIGLLGTPSAAYCISAEPNTVYYIWQSENFIFTIATNDCIIGEVYDAATGALHYDTNWDRVRIIGMYCYMPSYGISAEDMGVSYLGTTYPVQALTDLGLF